MIKINYLLLLFEPGARLKLGGDRLKLLGGDRPKLPDGLKLGAGVLPTATLLNF